ncbi:MAG TPA: glutamate--tRNA ligase [Myxococcota bacterium]|nr:glutamate--tRNA ligase [Myxococcota bacterium]
MAPGVTTRFAPSPTGHLHVGGARTALYSWALAQRGGRFLLRIEDTDRARSSESAARGILEDLAWLGVRWDEGPAFEGIGGDPRGVGPFFQTQRLPIYERYVEALVAQDRAYPAFETPEELDALRSEAQRRGGAFRYQRSPDWDRDAALARMAREPHVVRFRMPREPVLVVDVVLGEIAFGEEHLDDFVLRKRDGIPTYHFGVVVDDECMGVTHVLRGQEHLGNTPRHVALQRALGFRTPVYAHVPLILNADGSKLSKRDKDRAVREAVEADASGRRRERILAVEGGRAWLDDESRQLEPRLVSELADEFDVELPMIEVEDFRRAGVLPEVLCNYLALLGWSPGEKDAEGRDLERFDASYLAAHFTLERVGRGNARFDREKLLAFNQDAIAKRSEEDFFERWSAWCARYAPRTPERDEAWRRRYAAMVRTRSRTLADAASPRGPGGFALLPDDALVYDEAAVAKWLRKGDPPGRALLAEARATLARVESFEPQAIETAVKQFAESRGLGLGKVAQPLRVAATGGAVSPPLGETLAILGRDAVLRRIDRCLAAIGSV